MQPLCGSGSQRLRSASTSAAYGWRRWASRPPPLVGQTSMRSGHNWSTGASQLQASTEQQPHNQQQGQQAAVAQLGSRMQQAAVQARGVGSKVGTHECVSQP